MGKYFLILVLLSMVQKGNVLLIDGQTLDVVKGATVKSIDSVVYGISKIQCAEACLRNREARKCNLAGYHKVSRTCFQSLDDRADGTIEADLDYVVIDLGADIMLSQWAQSVIYFSSQKTSQNANQILGPADVYPNYGGAGVWCPANQDQSEFIEIQFAEPVHVTSIDIYETWGSGSVQAIKCYLPEGVYVNMWTSSTTLLIQESRIFSPTLTGSCFSNQIRIETLGNGGWSDFDAVMLHGNSK